MMKALWVGLMMMQKSQLHLLPEFIQTLRIFSVIMWSGSMWTHPERITAWLCYGLMFDSRNVRSL